MSLSHSTLRKIPSGLKATVSCPEGEFEIDLNTSGAELNAELPLGISETREAVAEVLYDGLSVRVRDFERAASQAGVQGEVKMRLAYTNSFASFLEKSGELHHIENETVRVRFHY